MAAGELAAGEVAAGEVAAGEVAAGEVTIPPLLLTIREVALTLGGVAGSLCFALPILIHGLLARVPAAAAGGIDGNGAAGLVGLQRQAPNLAW